MLDSDNAALRARLLDLIIHQYNFRNAERREIDEMVACAVFRHLREGAFLYETGDPVRGMYFILDGAVNIFCYRKDESVQSWGNLPGGNILSAYELYRFDRKHSENVRCIRDSVFACIPIDGFFGRIVKLPTIAGALLDYMAFIAEDCMQDVLCVSAADRMSLYFRRQMLYFKRCDMIDGVISLNRDHLYGEIADMTRLTRETVNRELKKMEKEKRIRMTKMHIVILDPTLLE